jgi:hypothetical protein
VVEKLLLDDFPEWGDVVDEIDIFLKSYISTFERGRYSSTLTARFSVFFHYTSSFSGFSNKQMNGGTAE